MARDLFEDGVPPLELTLARSVVAGAGLAAALGLPRTRPRARLSPWLVVAFGLSIALVNATYYLAIDRMAVAVAIVLQYTAPILVVTYTSVRNRRLPPARVLVALAAAVVGVVFVSGLGRGVGNVDPVGVALGLLSAVFFAAYTVASEPVGRTYGTVGALARGFLVAAVFWLGVQALQGWPAALVDPANLPRVLVVGVVGTLAPFVIYIWAVQRVAPERAVIVATLEPVLAALVAWGWLGERLGPAQIAGGLLVLGAVSALQLRAPAPDSAPTGDVNRVLRA